MKKLFVLASLLLLSACDDRVHVDLEGEMLIRPTVTLSTESGSKISGFPWNYCTDVVCINEEPIDFSALTFTPHVNGSPLTFSVIFTDEISSISVRTYNKEGEVTHRELPFTLLDDHTFLFEEPFPNAESEIALNIKVDFVNEGLAHYFFPIQLQ